MCLHCKAEFPTVTAMENHKKEEYKKTEEFVKHKRFLGEDFHKCQECPHEHCMRNGASETQLRLVFGQGGTFVTFD